MPCAGTVHFKGIPRIKSESCSLIVGLTKRDQGSSAPPRACDFNGRHASSCIILHTASCSGMHNPKFGKVIAGCRYIILFQTFPSDSLLVFVVAFLHPDAVIKGFTTLLVHDHFHHSFHHFFFHSMPVPPLPFLSRLPLSPLTTP